MRRVAANGIELCVDAFGDAADPAILLMGGGASSMDWWEEPFCARLAAAGRFVVRYDQRDTGQSTSFPAGAPPYAQADLAADAAGLLDALDVARAHVVAMSLGATIALRLALARPDRVASLALLSATPGGDDLPPMTERVRALFADEPDPDPADHDAVVETIVAFERVFCAAGAFDEDHARALARRSVERTADVAASLVNQAVMAPGEPLRPRLAEVAAPTLVIHGAEDPLYPLPHAEAMAAEIPGGRLLALAGVGHQMPPRSTWDVVVPALVEHTARA